MKHIIVTAIHKKHYIKNAIDNYERQNCKEKQLLLICNGEMLGYKNSNYNVINIDSNHISKIHNAGIDWMIKNKYDVYCLQDSDDYYGENYLSNQLLSLKDHDIIGHLDFRAKYKNDIYSFVNCEFRKSILGPTLCGKVAIKCNEELPIGCGYDLEFVSRHKNIGYNPSIDDFVFNLDDSESFQKRIGTEFIEAQKFYNTMIFNKKFEIYKNNELIWTYGNGYDSDILISGV